MSFSSKILTKFSKEQILSISEAISIYFNLASPSRIYDLIFQVDSIDTALHLLMCHKETSATLDTIVYDYLHHKDNL